MNKNDSERLAGLLSVLGFESTEDESSADLIIINSCSVRQSAEDRIFGSQEKWIQYKKERPDILVAVTGCMPGRDTKKQERSRLPAADLYFPTAEMIHLPEWIMELRPQWIKNKIGETQDYLDIKPKRASIKEAFVTIQTGCNKFCSYCVVPYARGQERNRSVADILQECRSCIESGARTIILLGQSVNSFRALDRHSFSSSNPFQDDFAALLWEINQFTHLERLHWTAAHPLSMTDEVIEALTLPKQVNYLHLPVQAGNNEVLRRMNRKYTREEYLDIIQKIKKRCTTIALGTDIIVGFCGETRTQFNETLSLIREVDFDITYHAQYSTRSGTVAAKIFSDDVSPEEKRARWDEVQACIEEIALRKNQRYVGLTMKAWIDHVEGGFAIGTTKELKAVRFPSSDTSLIGSCADVRIEKATAWMLEAEVVFSKKA